MRSKTYQAIKEKAPKEVVAIDAAVAFVQDNARSTFDETVELHVHLGVDPGKSDQMVRGNVQLPHGTPKKKRVAVFVSDAKLQQAVKDAGAEIVGGDELVAEIEAQGDLRADVVVATPDMMGKIAKVARILGPKGLMPNPKTNTVTLDVEKAVAELLAGKISFKMDQHGNIHEAIGKASWDGKKIAENIVALMEAVRGARPKAQSGEFIVSATVVSTMGPGVRIA